MKNPFKNIPNEIKLALMFLISISLIISVFYFGTIKIQATLQKQMDEIEENQELVKKYLILNERNVESCFNNTQILKHNQEDIAENLGL